MSDAVTGKELYVKNGNRYIALGSVVAGRLKFSNGNTLDIGKLEEIFEADLTESDKELMHQMKIDFVHEDDDLIE